MPSQLAAPPQIRPLPEFSGILRQEERYGTDNIQGADDQINTAFDRLMIQSGLDIVPSMLLLVSICSGIIAAGILFVIQENLLTAALAFAIGCVIPVSYVIIERGRRQRQMTDQLPPMIDELARAAKTGRSIEQCFSMVASDTPSPLGDELRLCARKLDLGLNLRSALAGLPERTGLVSLNIFAMALSVHQISGGDLVGVLERLSYTIRERTQYLGRLRAATAASRATAILMLILPPGILAFFIFRDPEYFAKLMGDTWGRNLTLAAIALDIVGIIWVLRILKTSERA